jgi:hypothetical protein
VVDGVQALGKRARGDDGLVVLGRGVDVVVIGVEAGGIETRSNWRLSRTSRQAAPRQTREAPLSRARVAMATTSAVDIKALGFTPLSLWTDCEQ